MTRNIANEGHDGPSKLQKCRLGRAVAFSSKHPRPVNRMKYEYWVVFLLLRPDR